MFVEIPPEGPEYIFEAMKRAERVVAGEHKGDSKQLASDLLLLCKALMAANKMALVMREMVTDVCKVTAIHDTHPVPPCVRADAKVQ